MNQFTIDFNQVFDSLPNPVVVCDQHGTIQNFNPATLIFFGYEQHELLQAPVELLMPSPYKEAHQGYINAYLKSGHPKVIGIGRRLVAVKKDATVVPILLQVTQIQSGEHSVFIGLIHDLSHVQLMENQLRHTNHLLREAQNQAKLGSWWNDPTAQKMYLSEEARQIFEVGPVESLSESEFLAFFDARDHKDILHCLHWQDFPQLMCEGCSQVFRAKFATPSHHHKWVRMAIKLVEEDGEWRVIGTVQDITELRDSQLQLEQAGKLAALGELAAGVGHEINNPMTITNAMVKLIKKEIANPQPSLAAIEQAIAKYEKASGRINDIVKGLMRFVRNDDRPPGTIILCDNIDFAVDMVSDIFKTNGIMLQFQRSPQPIRVIGSSGRLQQILMNLLVNAKDALEGRQNGKVAISVGKDDRFGFVRISDNGDGIAAEHIGRIFDPFFTTKDPGKGTGIGLSLSSKMAAEMGGTLIVRSEAARGATFELQLPLAEIQHKNKLSKSAVVSQSSLQVLILDGETQTHEVITSTLRAMGVEKIHECHDCKTAKCAEDLIKDHSINLLFVDFSYLQNIAFHFFDLSQSIAIEKRPLVFVLIDRALNSYEKLRLDALSTKIEGTIGKPLKADSIIKAVNLSLEKINSQAQK